MPEFTCFKCGDGNTPLYCLNCANDKLAAALAANAEMRQLLVESPELWTKGQSREWLTRRKHALSLESGKGFRSPAQVREFIEWLIIWTDQYSSGAMNGDEFIDRMSSKVRRLEAALKEINP